MKTRPNLPHRERAEQFARSLFTDPDAAVAREATARVTINLPAGLLCAVDAVATQGTRGNRSAAVVKLLDLGYGLLMEYLPADQREYLMELANAQAVDVDSLTEGEE
jgi:hypothetical protein